MVTYILLGFIILQNVVIIAIVSQSKSYTENRAIDKEAKKLSRSTDKLKDEVNRHK
jgi:hypothetical protein